MSIATQLIQQATAGGVKLFSQDGELKYEAPSPLPAEFLAQLKAHKIELLAELQQREAANSVTMRPHALLVRVSNLLGCSGDYLLKQGFLEPCDLEEQAATDPWVLAEGIRLDPRWIEQDGRNKSPTAPTDPDPIGHGEPQAYVTHWTAQIASPEWLQARDAYLNHLLACPECWAPIKRYCALGAELQAQYQEAPV